MRLVSNNISSATASFKTPYNSDEENTALLKDLPDTRDTLSARLTQFGWAALYTANATEAILAAATISATVQSWLVPPLVAALGPLSVTALHLPGIGLGIIASGAIIGFISLLAAEAVHKSEPGEPGHTERPLKTTPLSGGISEDSSENILIASCKTLQAIQESQHKKSKRLEQFGWVIFCTAQVVSTTFGIAAVDTPIKPWLVPPLITALGPLGVTAFHLPWMGVGITAAGILVGCISSKAAYALARNAEDLENIHEKLKNIHNGLRYRNTLAEKWGSAQGAIQRIEKNILQTSRLFKQLGWLSLMTAVSVGLTLGIAAADTTAKSWIVIHLASILGPLGIMALPLPFIGLGITAVGAMVGCISLMTSHMLKGGISVLDSMHKHSKAALKKIDEEEALKKAKKASRALAIELMECFWDVEIKDFENNEDLKCVKSVFEANKELQPSFKDTLKIFIGSNLHAISQFVSNLNSILEGVEHKQKAWKDLNDKLSCFGMKPMRLNDKTILIAELNNKLRECHHKHHSWQWFQSFLERFECLKNHGRDLAITSSEWTNYIMELCKARDTDLIKLQNDIISDFNTKNSVFQHLQQKVIDRNPESCDDIKRFLTRDMFHDTTVNDKFKLLDCLERYAKVGDTDKLTADIKKERWRQLYLAFNRIWDDVTSFQDKFKIFQCIEECYDPKIDQDWRANKTFGLFLRAVSITAAHIKDEDHLMTWATEDLIAIIQFLGGIKPIKEEFITEFKEYLKKDPQTIKDIQTYIASYTFSATLLSELPLQTDSCKA